MSADDPDRPEMATGERALMGRPVSVGFGRGLLHVAAGDVGDGESDPAQVRPSIRQASAGAVIVSAAITPAECVALDARRPAGLVLTGGSPVGHVAVMAQERGWPLLIGMDPAVLGEAGEALLDGVAGTLTLRPSPTAVAAFDAARRAWLAEQERDAAILPYPARTADGEPVRLELVVDDLAQLRTANPAHVDGVGLVRTEMLFLARGEPPGEEGQFATYRILLQWADGRPVAIRTLDPSGDKALAGLAATNLRGITWGLAHPEILAIQLRALLRAAAHGDLTILLPMVEWPEQVEAVSRLLDAEAAALRAMGRTVGTPKLGVMVETAAALKNLAAFEVDSYAIGPRDLAEALDSGDAPTGSAVFREAIRSVAAHAGRTGRRAVLCGASAADPSLVGQWLALGVRDLCVPAAALGRIKAALAAARIGETAGAADA